MNYNNIGNDKLNVKENDLITIDYQFINQNNNVNTRNDLNKNKNKNKKNRLLIMACSFLILLLTVAGYYAYKLVRDNKKEAMFDFNISAVGFEFDKAFDIKTFEYYLTVDTKYVQIACSTDSNVEGCNEIVAVAGGNVNHIVKYMDNDNTIYTYTIHITKEETMEPIKINSIISYQGNIVIDAYSSENKPLEYSFDNGTTWQSSNQYQADDNGLIQITIRDDNANIKNITIEVNDIDKVPPTVNITITEKSENRIVLYAEAIDDYSGVELYNWNNTGYGNSKIYEVTSAGTYTVSVVDKAGNESTTKSITITENDFVKNIATSSNVSNKKTYTIQLVSNGANITKTNLSCTTTDIKCTINLPTISRTGWTILGWSEDKNAQTAQYKVNDRVTVSANKTLYAITKKTITATFDKNGATSIGTTSASCDIYNTNNTCIITMPTITMKNGSVIGWSDSKTALTSKYNVSTIVAINADRTFYAITKKDATLPQTTVKTITLKYNANGGAKAPQTQTAKSNANLKLSSEVPIRIGYKFLGWSTSQGGNVIYNAGGTYNINQDLTLYAVWQKLYVDNNNYTYTNLTSSNKLLFNKTTIPGIYNYAPSAFQDDNGLIHIFYVGNKSSEAIVDHIYHRTIKKNSSTGYYYSNENTVLEHSSGKWDSVQVCDPTVIKGNFQYNGVTYKYLMAYLGVATYDNSLNQIGLAVSNNLNSQFIKVIVNSPFISYPANSTWGVGQPTAINLDGNGRVLISYTQGLTNKTNQLFGIYDLSNLNSPRVINSPKEISTAGALSYISNADIAIDLVNDKIWLTAHQGYTYEKNSVTGTTNYIPSKSMVMSKKLNFGSYSSLSDAVYYALTTSTNPWASTLLSSSNLIHNPGFIRDPYGYVNGTSNINSYLLVSTAQAYGSQTDQLWSYKIQLY